MLRNWYEKFRLKVWFLFFRLIEVRPFLKVDANAYCPACGHRSGQIFSVTDGKTVMVQHLCDICKWTWQEPTITQIDGHSIVRQLEEDEIESEVKEMKKGPFRRFVPIRRSDIRVNGENLKS